MRSSAAGPGSGIARRSASIAGAAGRHRGPRAPDRRTARSIAAVRRWHRRSAAGAGSRRHPGAGREPRASSRAARSAVRARPPSQGRGRRARLARRPRRGAQAPRPEGRFSSTRLARQSTMTAAPSDVGEYRARISGSSFYTAMRLMPKVEREAMFAVYMFCRLVDDIADDGTRPRPARAAALARNGARTSMRSTAAGRLARRASSRDRCRPSA